MPDVVLPGAEPALVAKAEARLYDAFISYSHAKDKALAAALQSAMQKLGKPGTSAVHCACSATIRPDRVAASVAVDRDCAWPIAVPDRARVARSRILALGGQGGRDLARP